MLNISGLKEGIVLDHIKAGQSMLIYEKLGLDKLDTEVAIIKNVTSRKMGKKDIIKIEGALDKVDLKALGFIECAGDDGRGLALLGAEIDVA